MARSAEDADPTDEETADAMRRLAMRFVQYAREGFSAGILTGSAEGDQPFGWESTEAARLDGICEDFLESEPRPSDEIRHSMTMSMGAYLGELLVRHGGGRWAFDPAESAAVVKLPNGVVAYPHNKVAKRLEQGPEHNLFQFYWYGLTKDVPPGSHVRMLPDPGA